MRRLFGAPVTRFAINREILGAHDGSVMDSRRSSFTCRVPHSMRGTFLHDF